MVVLTAIGAGILKTAIGAAIFGSLSAFTVGLITTVVLGAALRALTPKPSFGANRGYEVTAIGTALDHQIIYGKMRVGGARIYDEATGTTNQYLHRIIAVAGHEIQAFDKIYINDSYVAIGDIDTNGNVSTVTDADGTSSARYDGKLRIKFHLGSPTQTADSFLVAESDGHWTSTCTLNGIAYMYIRMEYDQDVYPDGIPEFTAVVSGKKVYDPRTSTTAWSDNPALCLRDYLISSYGIAEETANIDDTLVNSAANVCDQTNTDAGTTRYTCNGAFTTASTPYEMINAMLTSMDGSMWYSQGKWRMKPAYWTATVLDLNEDDLRSTISVSTRHSRRSNFNTVKGTFRGDESNWQTTDYPQVSSAASLAADGGQESVADVDLPFTDNSIEARRIARISLERNRQQLTVNASFGLKTLQVQVGDNIRLTNSRFGWTNKEFEVVSWNFGLTDGLDLQTQMTLRETAESVYDEVDDGETYERDNTNLPDPFSGLTVSNLVISGGGRLQGDGTFINSAILSWTAAQSSFVSYYDIQWKALSDSDYASTTTTNATIELTPLVDGVEYIFRVRAVSINGVKGAFVTAQFTGGGDVTAPGLPTAITATGHFGYISIDWTNPTDADFNFVEVWENTSNTSTGATKVGISAGDTFQRTNLGLSLTRYYFLKSVDYSGNVSGFTASVNATTTYIDDADFANGIYTLFKDQGLYAIEDVSSLPGSGTFTGEKVFNTTDGKLYSWTGTAWEATVGDVEAGSITATEIADGAISTPKLAANSVIASKILGGTITGDKITANTITGGLIAASGIITNSAQINDAVITNAKIGNAAVDTLQIQGEAVSISSFVDFGNINGANTNSFPDFYFSMPESGNLILQTNFYVVGFSGSNSRVVWFIGVQTSTGSTFLESNSARGYGYSAAAASNVALEVSLSAGNYRVHCECSDTAGGFIGSSLGNISPIGAGLATSVFATSTLLRAFR